MFYADSAPSRSASRWDPVAADAGPDRGPAFFDPAYLAGAVWKARWLVAVLAALGAVLAGFAAFSVPKQYTAIAQLVIDPRELNLVQNDVTVTPTGLNTDATLALIESQISVITSNRVLDRVVRDASLTADPEFNGLRTGPLSGLSSTLGALFASDPEEAVRDRALVTVNNLREHLSATRNANSFVINLSVRSEDAQKAARLANLTTEIFIAEQGRAQSDLARRATAALSSRLAELRQRVVESEDAVETYKAQNQLVGVGGRLIDDDYITRINNQLADVRAQITSLNVRAQSLREASVEDVAAGSFPEGLNAESLLRLRQTYSEAAQNQAILATRLGPRHPQRIAADQAVATARRAIGNELSRIVASAQTELARARQTETDLTRQIDTLRTRQIETSGAFVRLRELEREVDASRAVYEAYLLRARQTSEQESLNTANVRVISDATVPFHPSSLSRKIVVLVGLIGGLGLGIALAIVTAMLRAIRPEATSRAALDRSGLVAASPAPAPAPESESAPETAPAALVQPAVERQEPVPTRAPFVRPLTPSADAAQEPLPESRPEAEDTAQRAEASEDGLAADWALRGPAAGPVAAPEPADEDIALPLREGAAPALSADEFDHSIASETPEADDLEERRETLRERIRAIGARRGRLGADLASAPSLDDPALGQVEAITPEARRERISLRLAAARRRRAQPPLPVA